MHPAFPKCTLLFRNAPDSRENAPRFSGMHPTLRKMHPAFSEMHPEKSKMHPSLFFGAFFYQNMSTKPTERQGYVPTQIIEKREILTVRVSLSHFYPTLIRQLPSHFCFKTLLWVLAQGPPLRYQRTSAYDFSLPCIRKALTSSRSERRRSDLSPRGPRRCPPAWPRRKRAGSSAAERPAAAPPCR